MCPRGVVESGTDAGAQYCYRARIKFAFDCDDVWIHYNNRRGVAGGTIDQANDNAIKVACTTRPVATDARVDGICNQGVTDVDYISIPAGACDYSFKTGKSALRNDEWYLYSLVKVASGAEKWPLCRMGNAASDEYQTTSDHRYSGSASAGDTYGFGPIAVTGIPRGNRIPVVWLIDADSLGHGYQSSGGDFASADLGLVNNGFIAQAIIAAGQNYMLSSLAGYALSSNAAANRRARMALARYATHYVQCLGINDVNAGASTATIRGYFQTEHQIFRNVGLKAYQCTLTPWDSFSGAKKTVLNALNNEIRAGTNYADMTGYFEVADAAMTARDSDAWKASYSDDGVHPNAGTGIPALVSALTATFAACSN